MATIFDLYDDGVVQAAGRIFNTYGRKGMNLADRIVAVIDFARATPASQLSNEQIADVLNILDEVCEDAEFPSDGFDEVLARIAKEQAVGA